MATCLPYDITDVSTDGTPRSAVSDPQAAFAYIWSGVDIP